MFRRTDLPDELDPLVRARQIWFLANFRTRFVSAIHWDNIHPWFKERRKIADNFLLFPADPIFVATESEARVIGPGEAFWVPDGRWHWYGLRDGMRRTAHVILHAVFDSPLHVNPLEAFPSAIHRLDDWAFWYARLRRLACLACHDQAAAQRQGEALITALVLESIALQSPAMSAPQGMRDPRIARAVRFAEQNPERDVSIGDLAVQAGLGPVRFRQLFRQEAGVSPKEFLIARRIRRAADLLLGGTTRIADIARQCGFSTEFYFSNAFKRATGMSPSQYRMRDGQAPGSG
ncbi:MAG: AraC family transcriptional regulator [Planctomycetes bacterium]|nr:AraC family transcriptional regulator [Planctomycetota bacterium]